MILWCLILFSYCVMVLIIFLHNIHDNVHMTTLPDILQYYLFFLYGIWYFWSIWIEMLLFLVYCLCMVSRLFSLGKGLSFCYCVFSRYLLRVAPCLARDSKFFFFSLLIRLVAYISDFSTRLNDFSLLDLSKLVYMLCCGT